MSFAKAFLHFYPRPPRGGRPVCLGEVVAAIVISIHALREEGDVLMWVVMDNGKKISIHALREEGDHCCPRCCLHTLGISIHALREEGDFLLVNTKIHFFYFYPRPPRGGRPALCGPHFRISSISIHALREEGDFPPTSVGLSKSNFYPRPPRGGRPPP